MAIDDRVLGLVVGSRSRPHLAKPGSGPEVVSPVGPACSRKSTL